MSDLSELKQRYRWSLEAFIQGDPEPQKALWSRRDDVTLANPLGPPAKGLQQVFAAMERAAAGVREGEAFVYQVVSEYETPDLAYELAVQGGRMKLAGATQPTEVTLRVTSIFRREGDGWKLVHRHADPITAARSLESLGRPDG